ncbi:hypothetical protein [Roseibium sp. MMSF_3412]|uniref:hypothetical protein n=1 Tax=Roseibium sp. MMSF_3412 TaxID=3046712 RepID=UPI00273EA75A|nr:hypothetical protein [Roseibium sp. MMSF_3412]
MSEVRSGTGRKASAARMERSVFPDKCSASCTLIRNPDVSVSGANPKTHFLGDDAPLARADF